MQNRIHPKAPKGREVKDKWGKVKITPFDDYEPLSPINDRIIDGLLCELFKRKRIENKGE